MFTSKLSSAIRLFVVAAVLCLTFIKGHAATDVIMENAGNLSSMLTGNETDLRITGPINGTDIKYLRELINEHKLTTLDLSDARIVSGGDAYYETYTTQNNVITQSMFFECANLRVVLLPTNITAILSNAFARTGLQDIDIPNTVTRLGYDAFAYCNSLNSVVVGNRVTQMDQGVFYSSAVKNVYVKILTPGNTPNYFFSSKPTIHVYTESLSDYKESTWASYGTLVGGLEDIYPIEKDSATIAKENIALFFEDPACTQLQAEYQSMTDDQLTAAMRDKKLPSYIINMALKVKNDSWAAYEKDFRIHSYNAYSDANYWNNRMMSSGGSYMGNPTGIYTKDFEPLYVFVGADVPSDATLYLAGCVDNKLISNAKTGTKLQKGLNIIDGEPNALYYVLYTADTQPMTKTLSEWPLIPIHIEGGTVNGYYDVARHSDEDYKALLRAATHDLFTVKSTNALFNFKTSSYKSVWPNTIDLSICWFDSVAVWQKDLMGYTVASSNGDRDYPPYNISGGEAIYPLYYNNPNFAIQGNASSAGYANSSTYRTSYNSLTCISNCLNAAKFEQDEWCAGHECGHNNQRAINLEGGTEVSNNLFSNVCRLFTGKATSSGLPLSTTMNDYANHTPYFIRDVSSALRMYYQLYLYYHQARKNTEFYPLLFKALREDPLTLWSDSYNSSLKFVRKVCEVAQEDLTDFFDAWGFFEPFSDMSISDYGSHTLTVRLTDIMRTKAEIAKYPKKNRAILFVEDRADYVLTNDYFTTPGQKRRDSDLVGQCGDLGQYTDYMLENPEPSEYTYLQSDSIYGMVGKGGVGFIVLDSKDHMVYASNTKGFCIPRKLGVIGKDFNIYSIDADGTLHPTTYAGYGTEYVNLQRINTLRDSLSEHAIKAVISGPLCSTDVKYLRELVSSKTLCSLDLTDAKFAIGGVAYYENYKNAANAIGPFTFSNCRKLTSITLPSSITKIDRNAFSNNSLRSIAIPDAVATIGGDAFAYSSQLTQVAIGSGVKRIDQGGFYSCPVTDAYVKALTPPEIANYLFSSKPTIHVYASALEAYQASEWANFGTIVGDLDDIDVDEITGINAQSLENLSTVSQASQKYYDLQGRQVDNPRQGQLYIHNGKTIKF